jgi:hypothetical protein
LFGRFDGTLDGVGEIKAGPLKFRLGDFFVCGIAGLSADGFGDFVEEHLGNGGTFGGGCSAVEVIFWFRWRCGGEEKHLNVNRTIARGVFQAFDAAADVRFVNLGTASIAEWHWEISVAWNDSNLSDKYLAAPETRGFRG